MLVSHLKFVFKYLEVTYLKFWKISLYTTFEVSFLARPSSSQIRIFKPLRDVTKNSIQIQIQIKIKGLQYYLFLQLDTASPKSGLIINFVPK